jgi:hypothetical protein
MVVIGSHRELALGKHHIDNYFETTFVRRLHNRVEIGVRTEDRIDLPIIDTS